MAPDIRRLSFGVLNAVREVLLQGNVSAAAERLNISQPAVTQSLQRFEALTGVPLFPSKNGLADITAGELREPILQAVASLEDLLRVVQRETRDRPRLGLSDCLGVYFSQNNRGLDGFSSRYTVYIASPAELADLFQRGELDIVARPLFHYDRECELVTDFSVTWVQPENDLRPAKPHLEQMKPAIKLVSKTASCPSSYYISKKLREYVGNIHIEQRIDNIFLAQGVARKSGSYFSVPAFLLPFIGGASDTYPGIEQLNFNMKFGVVYNSRRVPLSMAMDLHDVLDGILI